MPNPLLRIEHLDVVFDGNPVVQSLSLTLNAGETLAIVGESGSGKTVGNKLLMDFQCFRTIQNIEKIKASTMAIET